MDEDRALLGAVEMVRLGRPDVAMRICRRVLALVPASVEAHDLAGVIAWRTGDLAGTCGFLRRAAILDSSPPHRWLKLAAALRECGRNRIAEICGRRLVALDPADPVAWFGLARDMEAGDRAGAACRIVLRLHPDTGGAWTELALGERAYGRSGMAVLAAQRAAALDPQDARVHFNLALMNDTDGDEAGAISSYRHALGVDPAMSDAANNLSLHLLRRGAFGEGWDLHEARLAADPREAVQTRSRWQGEPLDGRRLLIWGEQGIGDEIMFASCLPDVLAAGIRPTLSCRARLFGLYARSFPQAEIRLDDDVEAGIVETDVQIAMGSLPRLFRPAAAAFPSRRGYLRADAAATSRFRERVHDGAAFAVGVAWFAATNQARSMPLVPLVRSLPGVRLVDLQHGHHVSALEELATAGLPPLWRAEDADPMGDLDIYAALIAALDFVVTIDNTVAHLAGALGVPLAVMLPAQADWRWLTDTEECLWYPQARLLRQQRAGDWTEVLEVIARLDFAHSRRRSHRSSRLTAEFCDRVDLGSHKQRSATKQP